MFFSYFCKSDDDDIRAKRDPHSYILTDDAILESAHCKNDVSVSQIQTNKASLYFLVTFDHFLSKQ